MCTHVRIETRLALTSNFFDPPHPILIETRSYRRPSAGRPLWTNHLCVASLFGEMLLYRHQRIVTMTKVYIASNNLPVEIIRFHTIGFSDILSHIRNSTTTRYVFIADCSFRKIGISTSQLHYFMLLCTGSLPGKSVQAPIRL